MSVEALAQDVLEAKREIGRFLTLIENQNATIGQLQEVSVTARATAETGAASRQRQDQIMDALIGGKGKPPSFDNVEQDAMNYGSYDDEWRQRARSLYFMFTWCTEGTPLDIVRNISNQDGFEAHRRLSYHYDPQNMGSTLSRLMKVLEFDFGGESEFLDNLAKFENLIEEYEEMSKEALSNNIRSAVLIARAPDALKNNVLLLIPKEDIQWNTIKKTSGKWHRRLGKRGDWKGGKGRDSKGKCTDSKGKGKDRRDKGGKGDGKQKFQRNCGRCGNSWNEGWNTDDWGKSWGGQQSQGQGDSAPAQPSKETSSTATTAASVACQVCDDESAWIFAVGTCDGSKGARVGQVVDAMVDAGANRSVRGPQDIPDYSIIQDAKLEIMVANGAKTRHYGDKRVNLKTESHDEINVKFHVADATGPILSVTSINIAGAGAELPPSSARSSASIARDSRGGRKPLGLIKEFGLFFLLATVMACAGAQRGARGLVVNSAATDDATPLLAQEVARDVGNKATFRTAPKMSKGINGMCGIAIELRSPIMAWIARHASWTHDRLLAHRSDYKTSFERQNGKHCDKCASWRDGDSKTAWANRGEVRDRVGLRGALGEARGERALRQAATLGHARHPHSDLKADRKKSDGARSRFVARQFQDAQAGHFFACPPRAEAEGALMAAALLLERAIASTDFSDGAEIYVEMPPEYGMGRGSAWALKKSLYGLREGARVVVHMGDPLAPGPTRRVLDEFFDKLAGHLVIKGRFVLGEKPVIHLASSLQRFDDVIAEKSKPGHVGSTFETTGMTDCQPAGTAGARPDPTEPGSKEPLDSEEHSLHRRCCGTIQYAIPRRLGATHPQQELGRRLSEPRKADMKCLKHFLRYLNRTRDMAMEVDLRWSGAVLEAHARTESALAQSSPETKYLGAGELAAEMLYAPELLRFACYGASMEIECGALSAVAIVARRGLGRLRHLEAKWLWLQQLVGTGQTRIAKVKGIENAPDVGAKFLGKASLEKCRPMLGLAAVDGFGSAAVAALSAGRSARSLAIFMILVSGARAQPDQDRRGFGPLVMVMFAWVLSCVIIGLLFGYLRSHLRALPGECGDTVGIDYIEFLYGDADGADVGTATPATWEVGSHTDGESAGPSRPGDGARFRGGRPRMQLMYHLDDYPAMVHATPDCPVLANRTRWMSTRGTCSICCAVLPAERATLFHADSPETLVHRDQGCHGLGGRRRRLIDRVCCSVCFGQMQWRLPDGVDVSPAITELFARPTVGSPLQHGLLPSSSHLSDSGQNTPLNPESLPTPPALPLPKREGQAWSKGSFWDLKEVWDEADETAPLPPPPRRAVLLHTLSGMLGSMLAAAVFFPVETVKVHVQTAPLSDTAGFVGTTLRIVQRTGAPHMKAMG
ncbi:unnamed protein product [Prorocentrum cordatum]|uniref:Uncharacterized protein n=1 Tax=Prorocentrum cordatum TaxID=2364126 RepID=A0ABN9SEB9_9DINO|nr:unnamed protein product [Polarella glacialis]